MVKTFKVSLSLFFLLYCSLAHAQDKQSYNIITEQWPPFNYQEKGELKGYATEIIQLVMKELGVTDKITILPSARALITLNSRPRTIFYSFIKTPERENSYKWIGPFGKQSVSFYKRKGSPLKIKTLEDAKKVSSLCAREAGLVHDILIKEGFKNLDVSESAKSIYYKAIIDRCDLAISETHLGYTYWMNQLQLSPTTLEKTDLKIISSELYIVASPDISDKEVQHWQKALDKILKSKEYQHILARYQKI